MCLTAGYKLVSLFILVITVVNFSLYLFLGLVKNSQF